jgi:hypothetical protein
MRSTGTASKKLMLILMALAVGCFTSGISWPHSSNGQVLGDGSVRFVSSGISGATWGQTLRFCFGIKGDLIEKRNASAKMRIELRSSEGSFTDLKDFVVPTGFHCVNVPNADLPGDRDPRTGRIQVEVRRTLELVGLNLSDVVESSEVLDDATGKTAILAPQWSWVVRTLP